MHFSVTVPTQTRLVGLTVYSGGALAQLTVAPPSQQKKGYVRPRGTADGELLNVNGSVKRGADLPLQVS
ncbi:hypothetical protein SLEP1_g32915 [Rubroshorea leprosula]|uniref:Uncharacterized protein n=1 Tax=Rubroshorea leprosula TaxID=152421 RepID=A0AAV5KF23_9ROSI|nr:hypothetical protein SLEP1_g32915 [Rubroshorea leprosula]